MNAAVPSLHPSLKTIHIASPCPADWDDMVGDERRRFCNHCQQNVFNLSAMTERDADRLLSTSHGQLCTRLYRRADGTVLTQDCPRGWSGIKRRVSRVAGVMLSTALSICGAAFAQSPGAPAGEGQTTVIRAQEETTRGVSGTVSDITGAVIVNAALKLVEMTKHAELNTVTDEKGVFRFTNVPMGVYTLTAQSPGFDVFKKENFAFVANRQIDLNIQLALGSVGQAVEVGSPSVVQTKRSVLPRFLHR